MQITQELCKRPGLNRAGFDMQTIYVPNLIDKVLSFHLINTLMGKFCQQCLFRCCQIHNFGLFTYVDAIVMGSVVRSVDSAIHRIVIFSTATERHQSNDTRDIEFARDKKSDFNMKMLNFNMGLLNVSPI